MNMIVAASFDICKPENWYNRAFQYGDGLFETMRLHRGKIPLWELHQKRLIQGLQTLTLSYFDYESIKKTIKNHANKQGLQSAIYKLTVFRAGGERGYQANNEQVAWLLTVHPFVANKQITTLKLGMAKSRLAKQPLLAGLKHISRLEQVMIANELLDQKDADDLLVMDFKGRVIETTFQNLVLINNNQLVTPQLKHCGVKGVALSWLHSHFEVTSKHLKIKDLEKCDAIMVCNAIRGFRLVEKVRFKKHSQSFLTNHPVHDKISTQWQLMFD